jgi:hypothetical protein
VTVGTARKDARRTGRPEAYPTHFLGIGNATKRSEIEGEKCDFIGRFRVLASAEEKRAVRNGTHRTNGTDMRRGGCTYGRPTQRRLDF